jgi:uncharacterized integral membrane protein
MPWRLLSFIICLVVFAIFSAVNATNTCNIWIVKTYENVPIVIALVISFALGALVTLPFAVAGRSKRAKKDAPESGAAKLTAAEKKAAKAAQKASAKKGGSFPDIDPEADELIRQKLGQESPRGKFSLK